ncbi:MAG: hypothetical protein ABL894_08720 [Hyphomicrobium sp.]
MTRRSLNRTLRRAYWLLGIVLAISLVAKLADHIPGLADTPFEATATALYEYLRDMALVFVTVVAAYLANVFQKRSKFVESLEEEWRGMVRTKSALFTYCEKPYPSTDDYLAAFCRISETIDNMRIVYKNAGETQGLIGLYPYAPLHDMRRALTSIDPRKNPSIPPEERALVRDAILQSFYALRETFLEELDLKEPEHPLLISGARRQKSPGSARHAVSWQAAQKSAMNRESDLAARPEIDGLLARLCLEEKNATPSKPSPPPKALA